MRRESKISPNYPFAWWKWWMSSSRPSWCLLSPSHKSRVWRTSCFWRKSWKRPKPKLCCCQSWCSWCELKTVTLFLLVTFSRSGRVSCWSETEILSSGFKRNQRATWNLSKNPIRRLIMTFSWFYMWADQGISLKRSFHMQLELTQFPAFV